MAQALNLLVSYLPGVTMRRAAEIERGEAKTDARDARVIAKAARILPDTIRALVPAEAALADLRVLDGFDADLVQTSTALTNRMRGLLTEIHPALEGVLGPRLSDAGVLPLLERYPTPAQLHEAGARRITTFLRRHGSRRAGALATDLLTALEDQTVVVPGTTATGLVLPRLAAQLAAVRQQRHDMRQALVAPDPLFPVLMSLPGAGVGTVTTIMVETAGKTFASAAQFAAYAGHLALGHLDCARSCFPPRQQTAQACAVSVRLCLAEASALARLLRPEAPRRENPHACPGGARSPSL